MEWTRKMYRVGLHRSMLILLFSSGVQPLAAIAQPLGRFSLTGSMAVGRSGHTATALPNGKVLVVGGNPANAGAISADAELYDPVTGIFDRTGPMNWPRSWHSATLLSDGRVLITGGSQGASALVQAEVYDPSSNSFARTGAMLVTHPSHTATLLHSGKVLIARGTAVSELYDPFTGTFTTTGSTSVGSIQKASLLPDGRVLLVGTTSEIYDPETGTFTPTSNNAALGSVGITANSLLNGNVLVTGGGDCEPIYDVAEVYIAETDRFTVTGKMTTGREAHTATLLPNGEVLITGGVSYPCDTRGCAVTFRNSTELYDPATGTFRFAGEMGFPRWGHTATLLSTGQVLIAGGFLPFTLIGQASAELYTPTSNGSLFVINATLSPVRVRGSGSFAATFSGINLTNETYFDVQFRMPGSRVDHVALNWQQGPTADHEVPSSTDIGNWTITGIRAHQDINDHNSGFSPVLATLTVDPSTSVTNASVSPANVHYEGSFTATFSGTNLTNQTYFDVLFRSPGSNEDLVGLNWQQGASAVHDVPTYLQAGTWTITGVRAHESADDHSSEFFPVFATVTVEP